MAIPNLFAPDMAPKVNESEQQLLTKISAYLYSLATTTPTGLGLTPGTIPVASAASPYLIDSPVVVASGNVGIGTLAPATAFHVSTSLTTSPRGIMSSQHNNGTDGARFHMRKSRGTNAVPAVIVSGDNLGRLVATGYDGSNYLEMASIIFGTQGTIGANRIPTNISFWTATDANPSVLTQMMTVTPTGVGIGTTNTLSKFSISGNRTGDDTLFELFTTGIGATNDKVSLRFKAPGLGGAIRYVAQVEGVTENAGTFSGALALYTAPATDTLVEAVRISASANVGVGTSLFGTSAAKVIAVGSGTAPSTSPVDEFQMYSADIAAGHAAAHFRTELGTIIKLYQQALISNPSGGATQDAESRTAITSILTLLKNNGLMASV